jgi:hypothetical protein
MEFDNLKYCIFVIMQSAESISLSVVSHSYLQIDSQGEFLYGFPPAKQALIIPLH